eukprot:TRINITY_DN357_c0_g2_i1.p1 TRINITY_DN357_c0_g2~~TRINITY_DN357_c0_g2_i1.p1  ORF type:complete len:325 (+),score=96.07 TRINITY_DN357_c0_g2_i1:76-975(+)
MPPSVVVPKRVAWMAGGAMGTLVLGQLYIQGAVGEPLSVVGKPQNGRLRVPVIIIADFHCPWCYLAKCALDEAAKQFPDIDIEYRWKPYLLYSDLPSVGGPTRRQHTVKHGMAAGGGEETGEQAWARLTDPSSPINERGRMFGINFLYSEHQRMHNSIDAHKLMRLTLRTKGSEKQHKLAGLIYREWFERGRDIGDPRVLAELSAEIGFDPQQVYSYLLSKADREVTTRTALEARHSFKVRGVPFVKFAGTDGTISGVQRPDAYVRVLEEYRDYMRRCEQPWVSNWLPNYFGQVRSLLL